MIEINGLTPEQVTKMEPHLEATLAILNVHIITVSTLAGLRMRVVRVEGYEDDEPDDLD